MSKKKKVSILITSFICLFLVLLSFSITNFTVVGNSMCPTLGNGQKIVENKQYLNIKRGDIVIATSLKAPNHLIVKRVIGLPGEIFQIKNKKIYINGIEINEPYVQWKQENEVDKMYNNPFEIPKDNYFLLGDNRDVSYDSRKGGSVEKQSIHGKVIFEFGKHERKK